jgi:copper resistance protein C
MRAQARLGWAAAVVAIAGALVAGGAQAASAHDSLIAASPAPGDTVTSLAEVELTFSDNLLNLGAGNIVIVTGADGRHYETDCTALAGPTLTTPVALGAAGDYEVTWRAVSSDGHPVSDTYTFTYDPAPGAEAAAGSASPACATDPVADETAAPTDASTTASTGIDGLTLGLVLGGAAIVLVVVIVVVILRTRGKDEDPHDLSGGPAG